jgi:hypothetical protein
MTKNIASLITANGILLYINGQQFTVGNDHINFARIKDALKRKDFAAIPALADVVTNVRNWLNNGQDFELRGDQVYLNGDPFSAEVTSKVLSMIEAGANAEPLYAFLRKVRENPSKTAQDELLLFCVANGFMIHEDGDIIAYKSVRGNYTDIHSGKFRNAVGDIVTMERGQVDDNRDRTCSTGLHFASHEYASTWAGQIDGVNRRLMVMKINPRDVVSIPSDYNNQKGRCARYEVISELNGGGRLPKQEVYTNSALGVKPQVTQAERDARAAQVARDIEARRNAERAVRKAKLEAEIARKRAVIRKYEDELVEISDRIEQIENLGGTAGDELEDRIDTLENYIEKIEGEVRGVQRMLAVV